MRKKLLSALLGTTMVVSMLAGCGSSADTSTSQDTTTQEQKETTAEQQKQQLQRVQPLKHQEQARYII